MDERSYNIVVFGETLMESGIFIPFDYQSSSQSEWETMQKQTNYRQGEEIAPSFAGGRAGDTSGTGPTTDPTVGTPLGDSLLLIILLSGFYILILQKKMYLLSNVRKIVT
jgi:hypothetical protein